MSEAVETKKKKSKLPMIIMLIVVLAGGGFFATKGKGDKKEPEVKLGAIEPLGEFLVNLSDGRTYLRTEISVQVAEGKTVGVGAKSGADFTIARDAVITVLKSKSLRQVSTPEGMDALRREIALAINRAMPKDEKHEKAEKSDKEKKKSDKDEESDEAEILEDVPADERDHPEWDSETGPALKVYFTNFATQ